MGRKYSMRSGNITARNITVESAIKINGTTLFTGIGGQHAVTKYVDASVNSSGNGNSWDSAYKTILEATAACRDDYTDDAAYYIYIAPGTYAETDELRLYGHGIHLIGLGNPGTDSGVTITNALAGVVYGSILLAGANCDIANIHFNLSTDKPGIFMIASDNCHIWNCIFKGTTGTTSKAILMANVRSTIIEDCQIGEAGGDFAYGFYLDGGADYYFIDSVIRNNRIWSDTTGAKGIYVTSAATLVTYGGVIDRNIINLSGAGSTAKGIDSDNSGVIMIIDNYVMVDGSATAIEAASTNTGIIGNHTMAGTAAPVDPNEAIS
jgi:hypothetical protein